MSKLVIIAFCLMSPFLKANESYTYEGSVMGVKTTLKYNLTNIDQNTVQILSTITIKGWGQDQFIQYASLNNSQTLEPKVTTRCTTDKGVKKDCFSQRFLSRNQYLYYSHPTQQIAISDVVSVISANYNRVQQINVADQLGNSQGLLFDGYSVFFRIMKDANALHQNKQVYNTSSESSLKQVQISMIGAILTDNQNSDEPNLNFSILPGGGDDNFFKNVPFGYTIVDNYKLSGQSVITAIYGRAKTLLGNLEYKLKLVDCSF